MPHFLDLFVEELRGAKQELLRRVLTGEESNEVDRLLHQAFIEEWRDLPDPRKEELQVVAVDSGRALRRYSSGAFMYITRAIASSSWGKSYRNMMFNSHVVASASPQIANMVGLRSEFCEHEAILDALNDSDDVDVVLVDGSLYGRINHVPEPFNYRGERDLYLRFMDTFSKLVERCRQRKILLLGVSKDSIANHLTKFLMKRISQSILESLESELSSDQLTQLNDYLGSSVKNVRPLMNLIRDLPLNKQQYENLLSLVSELRRPRPDFSLISAWAETSGYTTPIEPFPDVPLFKYEAKNPRDYALRRFASASADHPGEEDAFEEWAVKVMEKVFGLPAFVTVCVKLSFQDTPLRIDVPASTLGLPDRMTDLKEPKILDPPPDKLMQALALLQAEYGGLDLYNVWLVQADQEARLPERDVTNLYEPLIEKELRISLSPLRRERRARTAFRRSAR
ncbi:MAG: DNA double-strand break repair nuclease NurA [Promethearchaeota archaeon]